MTLWTPANLTTAPHVWYDAQDAGTITLNGSTVSQWADKSGAGRHLVQASAGLQPGYGATQINSAYPGLTSDSGKIMSATVALTGTALYCLAVARVDSVAGRRLVSITASGSVDYNNVGSAAVIKTDGSNNAGWERNSASGSVSGDITSPEVGVIEAWWDGTNANIAVNGGAASVAASAGSFNAILLTLFARSGPVDGWQGACGEVVLLDYVPGSTDRPKLRGYAAHRWGLAGYLPGGDPYKSAAPEAGPTPHDATGALVGGGATLAGAAVRFMPHDASGALSGGGAVLEGSALRLTPGVAVTHSGAGALSGAGAVVGGSAAHWSVKVGSAALAGSGAALAGEAARNASHTASGALVGVGAALVGVARRLGAGDVIAQPIGAQTGSAAGSGSPGTATASTVAAQTVIAYPPP